MFSFAKIALLAAIIVAVLFGFRLLQRRGGSRESDRKESDNVAETVRCDVCGVYIPKAGISRCDRDDCPY